MIILLGLALVGLTLYMSTLAYALRGYSRARLVEELKNGARHRWLDWLDGHEAELQAVTGFVRVAANLGVLVCAGVWYMGGRGVAFEARMLALPCGLTLVLLLLFAIGLPHGLAAHLGERILARSFPLLAVLRIALWPVARTLDAADFLIRRMLGKGEQTEAEETERAEQEILDAVSEGEAAGAVDEEQKEIIESVFALDDTTVAEIMTPRTDINAIRADADYETAREAILRGGHSRIPVYEGSIDHVIGVLYAKDLLRVLPGEAGQARNLIRAVPFVPETKSISDLLDEFRQAKVQIAIVLDEYGGTAGLVTIEDILEELVGEIEDEYDQALPPVIQHVDSDTLEVDARVHVYAINEELGITIPENGDYETVGGFAFAKLGRIPAAGEEFQHDNIQFRIVAAEPRRINRLRIHVQRQPVEST